MGFTWRANSYIFTSERLPTPILFPSYLSDGYACISEWLNIKCKKFCYSIQRTAILSSFQILDSVLWDASRSRNFLQKWCSPLKKDGNGSKLLLLCNLKMYMLLRMALLCKTVSIFSGFRVSKKSLGRFSFR